MLRVIAGKCKGYKLLAPDSSISRPTRDMVRESIFSMIQFECIGATVLALFAGSGAIGIESLSRGAIYCDFVDNNKSAIKVIEDNVRKTKFDSDSGIHLSDYKSFLDITNRKYDIIFLDPPYKDKLIGKLLKLIVQRELIKKDGLIVYECSNDCDIDLNSESLFELQKDKKYGKTRVIILKRL